MPTHARPGGQDENALLLASVVAAAATGSDALAASLDRALAAGVGGTPLREALLLLVPFAGFPRALDGLAALGAARARAGLGARFGPGPETGLPVDPGPRADLLRARGTALFRRVYGDASDRVLTRLRALDPEVPDWVLEDAYGRVLARPGLSPATRERLAVVLLAALRLPNQLSGHVRGALACGATADEVRATILAAGDLLPADLAAAAIALLPAPVDEGDRAGQGGEGGQAAGGSQEQ